MAKEKTNKEIIDESDFSDEAKIEPIKKEEPVEEEKVEVKEEPKVEEIPEPEPIPEITDESLLKIEETRDKFFKSYKKNNSLKTIVTVVSLLAVMAFWIVPYSINGSLGGAGLVISLVGTALIICGIGAYSILFRKNIEKGLVDYFKLYYKGAYDFIFDKNYTSVEGDLDKKLEETTFKETGLYKDIFKVGSRYTVTFKYKKKMDCLITDCAAQTKGAKALQTLFVGKFLKTPNVYEGKGLYIYFKGNDRALPPNNLDAYELLEENSAYTIHGDKKSLKFINSQVKTALKKIHTGKNLVDVAISIQPGKTFFAIGYEDPFMIIPLQSPIDPRVYKQLKGDLPLFMDIAETLNTATKKEE